MTGQSWGGWSALYYFAKYKPNIIGVITFAPGIHGRTKDRYEQSEIIEEAVKFFTNNRINGLVFSHPEDAKFPTDPYHDFVKDVEGLTLVTDTNCTNLSSRRTHSFMYRNCSEPHNEIIFDYLNNYIKDQDIATVYTKSKIRHISSNEENDIEKLDKKLKYLKARRVILDQIKGLENKLKLLQKKLEILKLEFETGN